MNKDGKIKGKFNIIDLLVIVLILAVIGGIILRFGSSMTTAVKSNEEFEYVVRVEAVRPYTVEVLNKKGVVTDKNSNMDLGEIISVEAEQATLSSQRADGKLVDAELPGKQNVLVTIKTQGKESDNSYITADSNELSVGRMTEIYTKYVHTTGMIVEVKKIDK